MIDAVGLRRGFDDLVALTGTTESPFKAAAFIHSAILARQ